MIVSLLVTLCFSFSVVSSHLSEKYPVVMWSDHAFTGIKESASAFQMTNILDKISSLVEASKTVNVVVIVKEGMSSKELVVSAKKFDFLKKQIQSKSELYSNLREPFDTVAFAEAFNGTTTYTLQSMEELNTLAETIQEQLNSSTIQPKVVEVIVKQAIPTESIDQIAEKLQTIATAENEKTIMILSGKDGNQQEERLFSFQ